MMKKAIRGRILYFVDDPYMIDEKTSYSYHEDGILVIDENGKFSHVGDANTILPNLLNEICEGCIETYDSDCVIMPGFLDGHIHYPQTQMIAAYGKQLLDWLNNYTFKTETMFNDEVHAKKVAKVFISELIKNGVTTAAVYCTIHPVAVNALFEEADRYGLRLIAGRVLMDRNAPKILLDTPQQAYDESKMLIEKWHGHNRLSYAITPRFCISCSPEELTVAGALYKEYDDVYMQTHLAENKDEIAFTMELFPNNKDYTDIYDQFGLLGKRSIFGHAIFLSERELQRLHDTQSCIIHNPTSNLFLGSGLLDIENVKRKDRPVKVGTGSDVGAGTSFSTLETLNEAYKVAQLQGQSMSSIKGFYLSTLGTARALELADKVGTFKVGHEADIAVLHSTSTPLMKFRQEYSKNLEEELFVQMILGDDRSVKATYSNGKKIFCADKGICCS